MVEQGEVVAGQVRHRLALLVLHDDVDLDQPRGDANDGGHLLGLRLRLGWDARGRVPRGLIRGLRRRLAEAAR